MTKRMLHKHEIVDIDCLTLYEAITTLGKVMARIGEGATVNCEYDSYNLRIDYDVLETDKEYETRTGREKTLQEKEVELRRKQYEKLKKEFE